mgnify:CR=1 FL=1
MEHLSLAGISKKKLSYFSCDCTEFILQTEREKGRTLDPDCWRAIEIKRYWLNGKASSEQLKRAFQDVLQTIYWQEEHKLSDPGEDQRRHIITMMALHCASTARPRELLQTIINLSQECLTPLEIEHFERWLRYKIDDLREEHVVQIDFCP